MRFKQGELLITKKHYFGTTVWDEELNGAVDNIDGIDFVIAIDRENSSGWTRILTPNGKCGFIHRNNLQRLQVVENIKKKNVTV